VIVDNAGLARRHQVVFGEYLPGDRLDDPQRPVLDQDRDYAPDQRFGTE